MGQSGIEWSVKKIISVSVPKFPQSYTKNVFFFFFFFSLLLTVPRLFRDSMFVFVVRLFMIIYPMIPLAKLSSGVRPL